MQRFILLVLRVILLLLGNLVRILGLLLSFLKKTLFRYKAAAIIWTAIQYEMSAIIAGGTASGKTSALSVFAGFFPPNQSIISIEDTREIQLPKFLHWVPLNTVLANPEGKGEITMQDLLS
jgi:Flp pilus assembly CpaF family ATPase